MKQTKENAAYAKRRAKMVDMLHRGKSVRDIANVFDISTQAAYRLLKKEGVTFPKREAQ